VGKASGAANAGCRVQLAEKWEAKLFGITNYFMLSTNFKLSQIKGNSINNCHSIFLGS
jgi:hypothetical protein